VNCLVERCKEGDGNTGYILARDYLRVEIVLSDNDKVPSNGVPNTYLSTYIFINRILLRGCTYPLRIKSLIL
jgi:hypothetical protein